MIFRRRGIGTLSSSTPKGFSTEGPSYVTSGAAMALEDQGVAVIDLIGSAHNLSENGLRNTVLTLMTLPSAVAAL